MKDPDLTVGEISHIASKLEATKGLFKRGELNDR